MKGLFHKKFNFNQDIIYVVEAENKTLCPTTAWSAASTSIIIGPTRLSEGTYYVTLYRNHAYFIDLQVGIRFFRHPL